MASDRTRELAVFVKKWRDDHAQGWHDQECCVNELLDELQPLLDAFERETKLEVWNQVAANYCQCEELGGQCWIHYSIAALAQPTPEVKR